MDFRITKDALVVGVGVVPVYLVVRDILKVFKVENELLNVAITGVLAFEIAEYSGLMRNHCLKLKDLKHNERTRSPYLRTSDTRVCSMAMDFVYA